MNQLQFAAEEFRCPWKEIVSSTWVLRGAPAAAAAAGVTDEETLLSPDNNVHPDYYMSQLSELLSVKNLAAANVAA